MKNTKILLLIIVAVGTFFRFYQLPSNPVSLSMNEVAIAYNSYSILETGRDEWGISFPLSFRSVGDYKAPILIYVMAPVIKIFGLTEFSTRFTVALFGVLTIPVVYFLVLVLSKKKEISLFAAFSLAMSPWHVQFSRATFEAILALFFLLAGVLFFVISLQKKGKYYWLSIIFLIISVYSYHAERVFVPILLLGLIIIFYNELFKHKKACIISAIIGVILIVPFITIMLSVQGQTRAKMTFITNDENISYQLHQKDEKLTLIQKIFDNNWLIVGNFWIKRYLNYFDPGFLFFKGNQFTLPNVADVGLMYVYELPLFSIGFWLVFIRRNVLDKKYLKLIVLWFLIGPFVASLTNNEQHALRSLVWIPIPQLLVGVGCYFVYEKIKSLSLNKKVILRFGFLLIVIINSIYFFDIYFIHFPIFFSESWDYGWKEVSLYAWQHQKEYNEIVIDPTFGSIGPYTVSVPYLHILFYGKYPPKLFQLNKGRVENFNFRPIYWPKDRLKKNTLFIGSPWSLPNDELKQSIIHKVIKFKNGVDAFYIVETR